MTISVIVPTRDRSALLDRALATLTAQTGAPPFDIVVADNGSRDDTAAVVDRYSARAPRGVTRVLVEEPNRARARNRAVAAARGEILAFVDDDVEVPAHFLAAHARAHTASIFPLAVSGPIVNVYDAMRPEPTAANFSRAFFCTCNASVRRYAFDQVGGFDEGFDRYGWEDTDLGLRLRRNDVRRSFAWDAYLWHVKLAAVEPLEAQMRKAVEKGRMAARLLRKDGSLRTRLATGAYAVNDVRARLIAPEWSLGLSAGIAAAPNLPRVVRDVARAHVLDGLYARELRAARARE